jgi:hypothetical protein
MVPIHQITGSEGRGDDFDREFNPLQDHTRARWMGIAATQLRGKALPPVELTQVGDAYSIDDGHHRISVARALGQRVIEADVVICQMKGTWTPEAQKLVGKDRVREFFDRVLDRGAKLQDQLAVRVQQVAVTAVAELRSRVVPGLRMGRL